MNGGAWVAARAIDADGESGRIVGDDDHRTCRHSRLHRRPTVVMVLTAAPRRTIPSRYSCRRTVPLCQDSCRLNRIGTFGGAESRKWLDTDKRTKIG
jgi:hypothetical protein